MTPAETETILVNIPIGEAYAESARAIWFRYDFGAMVTLQQKLNAMVARGLIQRREKRTHNGFAWVYWRELPAAASQRSAPSTVLGAG